MYRTTLPAARLGCIKVDIKRIDSLVPERIILLRTTSSHRDGYQRQIRAKESRSVLKHDIGLV